MQAADPKRVRELALFKKFARAAAEQNLLCVCECTVELREPPEPDIFAQTSEAPAYFELSEIVDPDFAEAQAVAEKHRKDVFGATIDLRRIFNCFAKKADRVKHYESAGRPVHLVLYYSKQASTLNFFSEHDLQKLAQESGYDAVWIFNDWTQKVEWRWRRK